VIAVQNVQETNLAWTLIEVAKPHLNILERNYAFVTTGAGDTFAAIHHLLKLIAVKRIPLRPGLVKQCGVWLDAYAFHEEEHHLRHLIEGFLMPDAIRALAAATPAESRSAVRGHRTLVTAARVLLATGSRISPVAMALASREVRSPYRLDDSWITVT
jgi:hypothetical protein